MKHICTKHNAECLWKEGTSKEGKPYAFWACPTKEADGSFCKAPVKEVEAESIPEVSREPVEERQANSMLSCNAMNNTVALIVGGKADPDSIETTFKRILTALEEA